MIRTLKEFREHGYDALVYEIYKINEYQNSNFGKPRAYEHSNVNTALTWVDTPQGSTFWANVHKNRFEAVIEEFPKWAHLLEIREDKNLYKVTTNGLFKV